MEALLADNNSMTIGKDQQGAAPPPGPDRAAAAEPPSAPADTGPDPLPGEPPLPPAGPDVAATPDEVGHEAITAALERAISGSELATSPRLAAFLRFVVAETLGGRGETLKGYTIAVEALGRPTSFDPQADPIVRVEATRLRRALDRYYATAGAADPLRITIPKGSYVPAFVLADPSSAPAPEATAPPLPSRPLPPPATPTAAIVPQRSRRMAMAAALAAVAVLGAAALALVLPMLRAAPDTADRIRLPVIEVRAFERTGPAIPEGALRGMEERLRDAFARFDFIDVKIGGPETPEAEVAGECSGPRGRAVFSLAGLAEPREDGTFSLVARLADRCQGTIVWSRTLDGLRSGADLPASEDRVVREMAAILMNTAGVLPSKARARMLAAAPESPFSCLAGALAAGVLRGEAAAPAPAAGTDACLRRLAAEERESAQVQAVHTVNALEAALRDSDYALPPERAEALRRAAGRAADLDPASAFAQRALALVEFFTGEPEAAVASIQRAMELNPLDDDVAASAGLILIGSGQVARGEALLLAARSHGVVQAPLQETYLAIAAFLRDEAEAARALVPPLAARHTLEADVGLALLLHGLGRDEEADEVVQRLAETAPGGPETVRRLVRRLLPAPALSERALAVLEKAGLSRLAAVRKQRG